MLLTKQHFLDIPMCDGETIQLKNSLSKVLEEEKLMLEKWQ